MTRLRADAQRNLTRVLDAAAEAFAERGPDVSVDEIARRAGVGHATVFRRFATKDALIAAVMAGRLDELIGVARASLHADDAGAAFTDFTWKAAELHASALGLFECIGRCGGEGQAAELEELVARLVVRAQAAGALRSDLGAGDVSALISAAVTAAPPALWRRYVEVVLEGLRPPKSELSAR